MVIIKDITKMASLPIIRDFYADKHILVTGVTGLIGKVVLEKILRSCPEVKTVYCLVTSKQGPNDEDNLADVLALKVRRSE